MINGRIADLIEIGLILEGTKEYLVALNLIGFIGDKHEYAKICDYIRIEFLKKQIKCTDDKYADLTEFMNKNKDEVVEVISSFKGAKYA